MASEDQELGEQQWTCPECGEEWGSKDRKVPGGCVQCVDVLRYIEVEAPGMGIVQNEVAAVVCRNSGCDERVTVDPETLVVEDDDSTSIESKEMDMETGQLTGATSVEIYCSPSCRDARFAQPVDGVDLPEEVEF